MQMLKLVLTPPAQHRLRHSHGGVCDEVQTHHDAPCTANLVSDTWSAYFMPGSEPNLLDLLPPNPHDSSHALKDP